MARRVIDRAQWADFADAFSRSHYGWLVSVAVETQPNDRRYVARDAPLRGVAAEVTDHMSTMMIFTGNATPHLTHLVEHATSMEVVETADGAESAVAIVAENGARTLLEIRSPMRPELVDGIVC